MFVWNPLENNGFLFLIISKMTLMYALYIPGMSKPSKEGKLIKKIPNGSLTSTGLTLSDVRSFQQKISGSSASLQDTA